MLCATIVGEFFFFRFGNNLSLICPLEQSSAHSVGNAHSAHTHTHAQKAERWGPNVRLPVCPALNNRNMYTQAEISVPVVLTLVLVLTFVLRNSCKVKPNQQMQKDFCEKVSESPRVEQATLTDCFLGGSVTPACCCYRPARSNMGATPRTRRSWRVASASRPTRMAAVSTKPTREDWS